METNPPPAGLNCWLQSAEHAELSIAEAKRRGTCQQRELWKADDTGHSSGSKCWCGTNAHKSIALRPRRRTRRPVQAWKPKIAIVREMDSSIGGNALLACSEIQDLTGEEQDISFGDLCEAKSAHRLDHDEETSAATSLAPNHDAMSLVQSCHEGTKSAKKDFKATAVTRTSNTPFTVTPTATSESPISISSDATCAQREVSPLGTVTVSRTPDSFVQSPKSVSSDSMSALVTPLESCPNPGDVSDISIESSSDNEAMCERLSLITNINAVPITKTPSGAVRAEPLGADYFRSMLFSAKQRCFCASVMMAVMDHDDAQLFIQSPTSTQLEERCGSLAAVENVTSLSAVNAKLACQKYMDAEDFAKDVRLVFDQCHRVYGRGSRESDMAVRLEQIFEDEMRKLPPPMVFWRAVEHVSSESSGDEDETESECIARNRPRRAIRPPAQPRRFSAETRAARRTPPTNKRLRFCWFVLREIRKSQYRSFTWPFLWPVNLKAQGCPNYLDVIKSPMDVSTIAGKLEVGEYQSHIQFEEDVNLIFQNCYTINSRGDNIYQRGKRFEALFRKLWAELPSSGSASPVLAPHSADKGDRPKRTKRARHTRRQPKKIRSSANTTSKPSQRRVCIKKGRKPDSDADYEDSDTDTDGRIEMIEQTLYTVSRELLDLKKKKWDQDEKDGEYRSPWVSGRRDPRKGPHRTSNAARWSKSSGNDASPRRKRPPRKLSTDEKVRLYNMMQNLDEKKTLEVFEIIEDRMPGLREAVDTADQASEETAVELDLEKLDDVTCVVLHNFLVLGKPPPRRRSSCGGRIADNGPSGRAEIARLAKAKRKSMTMEEQAFEIDFLQEKLERFQQATGCSAPHGTDPVASESGQGDPTERPRGSASTSGDENSDDNGEDGSNASSSTESLL